MPDNRLRPKIDAREQERIVNLIREAFRGPDDVQVSDEELLVHLWLRIGEISLQKSFLQNPDTTGR